MTLNRTLLALAIVTLTLGAGCGGEETSTTRHRSATAGGEHRAQRADLDLDRDRDGDHDDDDTNRLADTDGDGDIDRTVADDDAPTAFDQTESAEDLEITRQIRAAVVADSSLSFGARNVTIITRDAVVTLRGNVGSNEERDTIDRHAHEVAGVRNVDNQIAVPE